MSNVESWLNQFRADLPQTKQGQEGLDPTRTQTTDTEYVGPHSERASNIDETLGKEPAPVPAPNDLPLRGPCQPWCEVTDLPAEWQTDPTASWAIQYASWLMWTASGQQFGLCERTVEPCGRRSCSCDCCRGPLLRLPGPIAGLIEIFEDGERWDLRRVRRTDRYHLELLRDGDHWPCGNARDRSAYQRPPRQACPPDQDSGWNSLTPAWASARFEQYGLTPPASVDESATLCERIFARHPELAYDVVRAPNTPVWVSQYMEREGIEAVIGTCDHCRDAQGNLNDPVTGRRYVCNSTTTVLQPSQVVRSTGCCDTTPTPMTCCNVHFVDATVACEIPELETEIIRVPSSTPTWQLRALMANPNRNVVIEFTDDKSNDVSLRERIGGWPGYGEDLTMSSFPTGQTPQDFVREPSDKYREIDSATNVSSWDTPSWIVRYWQGIPVPAIAQDLTCLLAIELMKARAGGDCQLTRNLTSLTRAGISAQFARPGQTVNSKTSGGSFDKFGIWSVDLWISEVNPRGLRRPPKVLRADDMTFASDRAR